MIDEKTVFVAFDTETTGLTAADGFIVEIAALSFDIRGNMLGEFSQLVNPKIPMPEPAYRVHRISDKMVEGMPFIEEVLPRFLEYIGDERTVLIAQNSIFDIGFINAEGKRYDIKLPKNIVLDQIDLTRKAFPGLPGYGLEKVCRQFNIVSTQTHRAMADAVLVNRLFHYCLNKWESFEERLGVLNNLTRYAFGGPMIVQIDQGLIDVINMAMERKQGLEIVYSGGSHQGHPRPINPMMLFNRDGVAYLSARCLLSNTNKQFRIDRITECRPIKK